MKSKSQKSKVILRILPEKQLEEQIAKTFSREKDPIVLRQKGVTDVIKICKARCHYLTEGESYFSTLSKPPEGFMSDSALCIFIFTPCHIR